MAYANQHTKSPFPFDVRTAQVFFNGPGIQANPEHARLADLEILYRVLALRGYALSYKGHGILVGTTQDREKPEIEIGGHADERPVPEFILRTMSGAVPVYVPRNGKPLFFDTLAANRAYFPLDLVVLITDDPLISNADRVEGFMRQKQAVERAFFHFYGPNVHEYSSELAGRILDTNRLIATPKESPADLVMRIKKALKK